MADPRIIAIHGAPRSGTTWLGQLFNSSEHVAYRYQPFFSYAFKNRLDSHSSPDAVHRFFADLLATDDDFVLQRGEASLSGYTLDFRKSAITHLVYKEVRYHELLAIVLASCPDAFAIGLVRHPCAVIHSWMNAPREFDRGWNILDEWRAAPSKNKGKPENWYGFEQWKRLAKLFDGLQERFPSRFRTIGYESLVAAPDAGIAQLFDFCGLAVTDQVRDFTRRSRERNDRNPYGVFRDTDSSISRWRTELEPSIIDAIYSDLAGTGLERYLVPAAGNDPKPGP